MLISLPKPKIVKHEGIYVVRDDKLLGGTKRRALQDMMTPGLEYVYASPAQGYAQVALAITAKEVGAKAHIFTAKRNTLGPRTVDALDAGALVTLVPHGYLSNVTKKANNYSKETGAIIMPFGLDFPEFIRGITRAAKQLDIEPDEVWCVSGSGVLTRALQKAWPRASHHAVRIGSEPNVGKATLWEAPEKYEQRAKNPPPFPSCSYYDAKAWQFITKYAKGKTVLFWNVAS